MSDVTDFEAQQVEQANATELTPVVFIHGLWLLQSSWDRWRAVFEESGYATLAPGWPEDPGAVPVRCRQRREGSRGARSVRHLRRAGLGCHAVPGGRRQPQSVDRGES